MYDNQAKQTSMTAGLAHVGLMHKGSTVISTQVTKYHLYYINIISLGMFRYLLNLPPIAL